VNGAEKAFSRKFLGQNLGQEKTQHQLARDRDRREAEGAPQCSPELVVKDQLPVVVGPCKAQPFLGGKDVPVKEADIDDVQISF
jgi:hypothetical protein